MPDPVTISGPGLSLHISVLEDAVVVQCRGALLIESSDFLKSEVKSRIRENGRMVLDLVDATRMDSSGLGAIVGLYMSARNRSCAFDLINLNKQVRDLFSISGLLPIFESSGLQGIRIP